ncbi:uncharacterized protein At3g49720-like [Cucurbita maxima]|uniref:Uncharacterized protein At3g49720-like n=1 Tax=Cucurbita maxima TaxID=3661 RepID=A0A6J1K5Y9_CUCMA|nr:uncharacterized protein At3g49720-like [Cucurbita maxima]XP_022996886.1 uncharacterized protein At3g49720-like [Cucurbita maxima]XP_022996895.1 uncharacterized protein At3g49720-like [Cucurbita maxima]XP_022996905.1 uncharacterized protein At3g49720-like [Cucurbita maxima]XP_022996912.1 uncharacterized protein At3g49720-like [Cucurbita maxima]XP_022996921.1 uncharacterized protein At3g49720-like [Cucurbita maxima]
MSGFEVSMPMTMVLMRQNRVNRYVARGANQYINSLLSILSFLCLLTMAIVFIGYLHHASGGQGSITDVENDVEGHTFCTSEVQTIITLLKEVYDYNMNKVLYVGPDTGSVMPELLEDKDDYVDWGMDPYDTDGADSCCWDLIEREIVHVSDMKFPLPYREKSFSHVIVSDTLEYMSSRYLNETIPEFMRVSRDGIVIFAGHPDFPVSKFNRSRYNRQAKLRSPSWWKMYLAQRKFKEDAAAKERLNNMLKDISFEPACQIFLLKSEPFH